MTHSDGLSILDEYFKQSAIRLGLANNVERLEKSLIFIAKSTH